MDSPPNKKHCQKLLIPSEKGLIQTITIQKRKTNTTLPQKTPETCFNRFTSIKIVFPLLLLLLILILGGIVILLLLLLLVEIVEILLLLIIGVLFGFKPVIPPLFIL